MARSALVYFTVTVLFAVGLGRYLHPFTLTSGGGGVGSKSWANGIKGTF